MHVVSHLKTSHVFSKPAGIQAAKLEDLERRLRADMLAEASNWGGKVLLHREVAAGPTPLKMRSASALGGPTPRPSRPPSRPPSRGPGGAPAGAAAAAGAAADSGAAGAAAATDAAGTAGAAAGLSEAAVEAAAAAAQAAQQAQQAEGEDITRTTQYQPTMQVQAFWETCGDVGDIDQVRSKRGGFA